MKIKKKKIFLYNKIKIILNLLLYLNEVKKKKENFYYYFINLFFKIRFKKFFYLINIFFNNETKL
jgi:hypothetical protein